MYRDLPPCVRVLRRQAPAWMLAGVLAGVLASCGGAGVVGSGGTGQAASVTLGTVNGFGSVIVDGVAYDVSHAAVVSETAPGVQVVSDVKLGDRVAVDHDLPGVATRVRVEAALDGPVTAVQSPTQFTALGQTVTVNTSGVNGPVTQFGGGYLQPGDVQPGDPVEVHAVLVVQGAAAVLQATRIDKLAAPPAYLRVTGILGGGGAQGGGFSLGSLRVQLNGAAVEPSGSSVAAGDEVTLLALPGGLVATDGGGLQLTAAQVRLIAPPVQGQLLDISGYSAVTATFQVRDVTVQAATASLQGCPSGGLSNGQYVQVQGTLGASGVVAVAIACQSEPAGATVERDGVVGAVDAVAKTLVLTPVQGAPLTVQWTNTTYFAGVSAGTLSARTVQVQGTFVGAVLVASRIGVSD